MMSEPSSPARHGNDGGSIYFSVSARRRRTGSRAPPLVAAGERLLVAIAEHEVVVTDLGLSVRHLDRLLGGLLLATSSRVEWAKLLRRTYDFDVLACTVCGGRLRLLRTSVAQYLSFARMSALSAQCPRVPVSCSLSRPVCPSTSQHSLTDPPGLPRSMR